MFSKYKTTFSRKRVSLIQLPSTTESFHPLLEAWEFHTLYFLRHESVKLAEMLHLRGAHRVRRRGSGGPRFAPGHEEERAAPNRATTRADPSGPVCVAALSPGMTEARGLFWAMKGYGWQVGVESAAGGPRGGVTLWDVNGEKEQKWTDEEKEGG